MTRISRIRPIYKYYKESDRVCWLQREEHGPFTLLTRLRLPNGHHWRGVDGYIISEESLTLRGTMITREEYDRLRGIQSGAVDLGRRNPRTATEVVRGVNMDSNLTMEEQGWIRAVSDPSMPNRPYSHALKGSTGLITKVFCPMCPQTYSLHDNDKCPHCGCVEYKIREESREVYPHQNVTNSNSNRRQVEYGIDGERINNNNTGWFLDPMPDNQPMYITGTPNTVEQEIIYPGAITHSNNTNTAGHFAGAAFVGNSNLQPGTTQARLDEGFGVPQPDLRSIGDMLTPQSRQTLGNNIERITIDELAEREDRREDR